ncbi:MAG: nitrogenase iron-molybdenum cofactor biosynthesis protein NifN [Pseudomonadota bacterium]
MTEIIKRNKALAVNPLKTSAPTGASLAFLGIHRAMPMMHGSQGCTAFAKVFFVRHFREPIPLQTTAMDQASTVLGADDNVIQGLATLCEKSKPDLIGLPTTGLSETQGTDIHGLVRRFRLEYPQYDHVAVIPVNTPDFSGCLESGYADAVKAMIEILVPEDRTRVGSAPRQINILASAMLTPGDIEAIREMVEAFGLSAIILPDLGDAMDGHLIEDDFNPLTIGGARVEDIARMGESCASLTIGRSLSAAAEALERRTGVPDFRFDTLLGLEAVDAFVMALSEVSGRPVPARLERQRAQLQDAMVDTHFMMGFARVGIAADPDLLLAMSRLVRGMGGEVVAAVAPARGPALHAVAADEVLIGDLEDLETRCRERHAELLIGSSHAVAAAQRLSVPILRAGFPLYDQVGGYQRTWVGYRGTRQALFDLANLRLEHHAHHHELAPYHSRFRQPDAPGVATFAASGTVH